MILSIDPGLRTTGVALWQNSLLVEAKLLQGDKKANGSEAWRAIGYALIPMVNALVERVIVELPQVYVASRSKADPNDLIQLAAVVGTIGGMLRDVPMQTVLPRQWKGNIDKAIMVERIQSKLSAKEKGVVKLPSAKSLSHNVWDAIGVGLWYLKR